MKNNLWKTCVLTLIVTAALFALFYLPRISIAGIDLRRVNILSDVQRRDSLGNIIAEAKADSIDGYTTQGIDTAAVKVKQLAYKDTVPEGMTAIEDFADVDGRNREMDKFYNALGQAHTRPVRIAYFGDSYIEGDILTIDLRAMLQQRFGGCGAGFVEIDCVAADFRRSVNTKRAGWTNYHANEKGRGFKTTLQGMAGSYFIPRGTASMELRGQKHTYANLLDTADVATVYFTPGNGLAISCAINSDEPFTLYGNGENNIADQYGNDNTKSDGNAPTASRSDGLTAETDTAANDSTSTPGEPSQQLQQAAGNVLAKTATGRIGKFSIDVRGGSSSRFYGVALDGRNGVALDNFSMRGSGGQFLEKIPLETMRSFASVRPYDLIVLHYGLNVAGPKVKDYHAYTAKISKAIGLLKQAYPEAAILVVSMGDRGAKGADGQMHTMDGVRELVQYERKMASDCHIAFWNLYEAMGGDGSIARMKENKLANLDFTHINFAGGRHLAKLLFDVLMNGKQNYENRSSAQQE